MNFQRGRGKERKGGKGGGGLMLQEIIQPLSHSYFNNVCHRGTCMKISSPMNKTFMFHRRILEEIVFLIN